MRRPLTIVGLLTILTVIGIVGFRVIEHWSWLDSAFYAIITVTTVGHDIPELSDLGKLFVIFYLITCLGIFTYSAFQLGQWIVSVEVHALLERRRMQKLTSKLHDHFIVCGAGRMGRTICQNLHDRGKQFVVIDIDGDGLSSIAAGQNWTYLVGDVTDDTVLKEAGIERATALAAVLPTDADNVYVVLSARLLSAKVQIIARASDEKAAEKMERAGASRVVSPYRQGALKMARFMVSPNVEDFLEIAGARGQDLELADIHISEDSPYVGKQLMETDMRALGVMIIGIRRDGGERLMPPPGSATIETGDCLFAFGSTEAVNKMIGEMQS